MQIQTGQSPIIGVQPQILESKVLIFDDALPEYLVNSFLNLVEHWQFRFTETETGDDHTRNRDTKKRDSLVLFEFEPIYTFFRVHLYKYANVIQNELGYTMDMRKGYECQLTAHNDGHFYSAHTDYTPNTNTRVSSRELTFVYYFYREPKAFSGGELFVWDHLNLNTEPLTRAGSGKIIEPKRNRLIFFDSRLWHEVQQVNCNSYDFMDSRFTLNGWMHRG
jgi:Rps23 Pro-64 3,4-dihydroxylase Tpa1-like proline 4-hydroxylase